MKVAFTTKRFIPILGGSINYAVMMATKLQEKGVEVIIMTRTPGTEVPIEGIQVMRCPSIKERLRIARWADLLLQVDASWQDAWPFMLFGKPWFPTIHNGKKGDEKRMKVRLVNFFLRIAFRVGHAIPVGDQVAKDWQIDQTPIRNPYNEKLFFLPQIPVMRSIELLFVGRIEESKGIFVLIEALKRIQGDLDHPIHCCFVGEGADADRLRKMTSSQWGRITFSHSGRLSPTEVGVKMRDSKILVFPTTPEWIEASPLTPLEALACGCRIIAADSGGTRENIGPDGLLVPSGEITPLAEAILTLVKNPPDRDYVAVAKFLDDRTLDKVADRYLNRFRQYLH